jgi:DNA-directed RNA polymerase subunit RPC12/RpoP
MNEDEKVFVGGKELQCAHCGGARFTRRQAQLSTAFMSLLNMEWMNRSADVYVCTGCGHLEWFLEGAEENTDSAGEPTECLSCGSTIPAGEERCPDCGWSYKSADPET